MTEYGHLIGGKSVAGTSGRTGDVFNPSTGEVAAKVALATKSETEAAIENAQAAFEAWSRTSVVKRSRVMFKFLELATKERNELATTLSNEHGKIHSDALGDLQRGLEVVEFACGAPHLMKGECTDNVSTGIDMYSLRQPLGGCAGITPFNFAAMVPLWTPPLAIASAH